MADAHKRDVYRNISCTGKIYTATSAFTIGMSSDVMYLGSDFSSPTEKKSQQMSLCVYSPRCPLDPDQCRTNAICKPSPKLCPPPDSVTILNPTTSRFLFCHLYIFFLFSKFCHTGLAGQTRCSQGQLILYFVSNEDVER